MLLLGKFVASVAITAGMALDPASNCAEGTPQKVCRFEFVSNTLLIAAGLSKLARMLSSMLPPAGTPASTRSSTAQTS